VDIQIYGHDGDSRQYGACDMYKQVGGSKEIDHDIERNVGSNGIE
jgi:hypothetical protein